MFMLKNARLNTKISVCFSLLLAFITAVACVVLAEFYRDSSLRQSGLLLQTVGDAAVQQLEMTFDEMNRISARLFFSSEISEAMKDAAASTDQSEYFEEHYSVQDTVRNRIFSIVSTSNSDTIVNLYNRNAFISNRYTQCFWNRIQTSMEDGLLAQLDEELGGANTAVLSGPHDAYWTTDYYDSNSYISLTRNYINYNTKKVLGKVQILKRVEGQYQRSGNLRVRSGGDAAFVLGESAAGGYRCGSGLPGVAPCRTVRSASQGRGRAVSLCRFPVG